MGTIAKKEFHDLKRYSEESIQAVLSTRSVDDVKRAIEIMHDVSAGIHIVKSILKIDNVPMIEGQGNALDCQNYQVDRFITILKSCNE